MPFAGLPSHDYRRSSPPSTRKNVLLGAGTIRRISSVDDAVRMATRRPTSGTSIIHAGLALVHPTLASSGFRTRTSRDSWSDSIGGLIALVQFSPILAQDCPLFDGDIFDPAVSILSGSLILARQQWKWLMVMFVGRHV